jgi:inosine/xanthosine triphosphate pyrophosphatase family protein
MPPELLNMLIQLPIVAAFIWYSFVMNKSFQEFLREERRSREESFDKLLRQLEEMDKNMTNHRAEFNAAVVLMRDRTERTGTK